MVLPSRKAWLFSQLHNSVLIPLIVRTLSRLGLGSKASLTGAKSRGFFDA